MNTKAGSARSASAGDIRHLLSWAAEAASMEFAPSLLRRASLVLADDICAMVAGSREPEVRAIHAMNRAGPEEATVFGVSVRERVSADRAALANGMSVTWCELDEGVRSVPCHAGAYILPSLLAEAERLSLPAGEMLARLIVGYETLVRIAKAFPFDTMRSHPHGVWASLGAALGAALARGYDCDRLLGAASGAVTMAFAAPFSHAVEGALVRNAWTSAGARVGMLCADWAEAEISGIAESFHDALSTALGAGSAPMDIAGLGDEWVALEGYHKQFACCQYAHSAIAASLALRRSMAGGFRAADEIERIVVETHPLGETLDNPEPESSLAAKFSMYHAVSAASVLGTGGPSAFGMEAVRATDVAAMRSRVTIRRHDAIGAWPEDRPARVTWQMRDGRRLVEECRSAPGGADRPLTKVELLAKFEALTRDDFPEMAGGLKRLIELDRSSLEMPWARLVDEIIGRNET